MKRADGLAAGGFQALRKAIDAWNAQPAPERDKAFDAAQAAAEEFPITVLYRAPKLTQWGDLQEVTLNVGKAGGPDGAKLIGTNKATH